MNVRAQATGSLCMVSPIGSPISSRIGQSKLAVSGAASDAVSVTGAVAGGGGGVVSGAGGGSAGFSWDGVVRRRFASVFGGSVSVFGGSGSAGFSNRLRASSNTSSTRWRQCCLSAGIVPTTAVVISQLWSSSTSRRLGASFSNSARMTIHSRVSAARRSRSQASLCHLGSHSSNFGRIALQRTSGRGIGHPSSPGSWLGGCSPPKPLMTSGKACRHARWEAFHISMSRA